MEFGVSSPVFDTKVATKAPVEDWEGSETIQLFAFHSDAAGDPSYEEANAYIKDVAGTIGTETSGKWSVAITGQYYYKQGKYYTFLGYFLGGATAGSPAITYTSTDVTLKATIDGTNDVMIAQTNKDTDKTAAGYTGDVYTATSARKNVVPNLVFEHVLSKFDISVKAGGKADEQQMKVNAIRVKKQSCDGTIDIVAKTTAFDGTATDLTLMNDAGAAAIHTLVTADKTTPVKLGSAMVAPAQAKVILEVDVEDKYSATETLKVEVDATKVMQSGSTTTSAGLTAFKAGEAYNITLVIYDLQQIAVTASITDWVSGGDFTWDEDL